MERHARNPMRPTHDARGRIASNEGYPTKLGATVLEQELDNAVDEALRPVAHLEAVPSRPKGPFEGLLDGDRLIGVFDPKRLDVRPGRRTPSSGNGNDVVHCARLGVP